MVVGELEKAIDQFLTDVDYRYDQRNIDPYRHSALRANKRKNTHWCSAQQSADLSMVIIKLP
ncbi:transcription-repair coupling factor [Vibrio cholerae]|nr:transcription-repair coupling factor [Vibrio cholerae]